MLFLPINVVATIVVVAADAHIFEVFASKPSHWGKGCCSVGVDHIFEVFASKPSCLGKGCYCCWPYLPSLWSKAKLFRQRLLLLLAIFSKSLVQSQAVEAKVVVAQIIEVFSSKPSRCCCSCRCRFCLGWENRRKGISNFPVNDLAQTVAKFVSWMFWISTLLLFRSMLNDCCAPFYEKINELGGDYIQAVWPHGKINF